MQKFNVLIAICISVCCAQAQKIKEVDVPEEVKQSFVARFPLARQLNWSKEGENEFEAEFKTTSGEQSANFDAAGKWLGTETEIKKNALPMGVTAALKRDFADYHIEEAEKAETPDQGVYYEIELEKKGTTIELRVTAEGRILRKQEKKDEHDKDN